MPSTRSAAAKTQRTPAKAGRPSPAESARITACILANAAALFVARGYAATSMEEIAARSGVGKQAIYQRFATKDDLFVEVYNREIARLAPSAPARQDDADEITQIRAACRAMTIGLLHPSVVMLCRIAYAEAARFPQLGQLVKDKSIAGFAEPVSRLVAAAQDKGLLPPANPVMFSHTLMMSCYGFPFLEALLGDTAMQTVEAREAYFEQVWPVVMAGFGPNPAH